MKNRKYLSGLHTYPIKSCKGLKLDIVKVNSKGPDLDRRWMLVENSGHFLSQRKFSKMALIDVVLKNEELPIFQILWISRFPFQCKDKSVKLRFGATLVLQSIKEMKLAKL